MILSSPLVDHRPSTKLSSPDSVTYSQQNTQISIRPSALVDAAVNVLNNEDGSVAHPDEQPPEVRVGLDLSELEIVYVKLEVVGHGGDEAGLAGARWSVEQAVVHGERVEGGGVAQVDGGPGVVLDHVHLEVPVLVVHGLGRVHDEGEVRPERLLLVLLVEAHLEGLDLEAAPAPPVGGAAGVAVAAGVGVGGGAGAGVVAGDEAPGVVDAVVDVEHLLALVHGDHDALGVVDPAGAEALHVGVDPRGEVGARSVVDLVGGQALRLVDDDGVGGGDARADASRGRPEQLAHLVRDELADHAAHHHGRPGHGRRRRHVLLVVAGPRHGWLTDRIAFPFLPDVCR